MHEANWKPSRSARKLKEAKETRDLKKQELDAKAEVRRRDRWCRFPLCGCRRLKWRTEVSHEQHKGAGGNPDGSRSKADIMLLLCVHRHQDGRISRHKGTLKVRYLTARKANGPVSWLVDVELLKPGHYRCVDRDARWFEVARETAVQRLEPLTIEQEAILRGLASMEL